MSEFVREATATDDILEIPRVFKCYEYQKTIGIGSTAVVAVVRDNRSGALYAAKIMKRPLSSDIRMKYIEREMRFCRRLTSPHIVNVVDIVYLKELICAVMEYCERGDLLGMIVSDFGTLNIRGRDLFRQICLGLEYLHKRGMAHRDIKPENILIDREGNAKVCDYGFLRETEQGDMSTTLCGTLSYAAPEVIQGRGYAALKSDMWSLGVVLFTMLMGSIPWSQVENEKVLADEICRGELNLQGLPVEAGKIISRCCELDVEKRATIDQVLEMQFTQPKVDPASKFTSIPLPPGSKKRKSSESGSAKPLITPKIHRVPVNPIRQRVALLRSPNRSHPVNIPIRQHSSNAM